MMERTEGKTATHTDEEGGDRKQGRRKRSEGKTESKRGEMEKREIGRRGRPRSAPLRPLACRLPFLLLLLTRSSMLLAVSAFASTSASKGRRVFLFE
ncbi:uncharacterized protein DS421_13g443730 [Arachis hypogaea]|nr:uncharacterized protein DS421_13g443730 [Arachis hypogaea]